MLPLRSTHFSRIQYAAINTINGKIFFSMTYDDCLWLYISKRQDCGDSSPSIVDLLERVVPLAFVLKSRNTNTLVIDEAQEVSGLLSALKQPAVQ